MENLDTGLLYIISGIVGFCVMSLTGIVVWLFKSMQGDMKKIGEGQQRVLVQVTKIEGETVGIHDSVKREMDMMREVQSTTREKVIKNADDIGVLGKEVAAIAEWKRMLNKLKKEAS